jgi:hypothetical protein
MRALLECVWPAALPTARQPFRSLTWTVTMSVVLQRDGGDLARTRRLGRSIFGWGAGSCPGGGGRLWVTVKLRFRSSTRPDPYGTWLAPDPCHGEIVVPLNYMVVWSNDGCMVER